MKNMTQKQYLKHDALLCPVCRSYNVSSGRPIMGDFGGSASVTCRNCGSTWEDIIQVTGYCCLIKGKSAKKNQSL